MREVDFGRVVDCLWKAGQECVEVDWGGRLEKGWLLLSESVNGMEYKAKR